MIPFEELDRALARWKTRAQTGAVGSVDVVTESEPIPAEVSVDADATPLPVSADEVIRGVPEPSDDAASERTGEIDLAQVESYEEDN